MKKKTAKKAKKPAAKKRCIHKAKKQKTTSKKRRVPMKKAHATVKRSAGFNGSKKAKRHSSKCSAAKQHNDRQVIIMNGKKPSRRRSHSSAVLMGGNSKQVIRRMGANTLNVASGIAGGVAGAYLSNMLPIQNAKIKAAVPTVAGIALASLVAIPALKFAGIGLGVVGGLSLLRQFLPAVPMLSGMEQVVFLPAPAGDAVEMGELTNAADGSAPSSMGYVTQNDL